MIVNVFTVGPSGMQERVLEEVMLSRWDSSPPLHSGTQSPIIVIHDSSDSEPDLCQEFTPSPSRLPTETTRESITVTGESEEPPQLTTMASNDVQNTNNRISPPTGVSSTRSKVPSLTNAQTRGQEEQTSTESSVEDVALKEHEQTISALEGTADEHIESCPEVSSSAAIMTGKPAPLHDGVSSTSENIESVSQPSGSAASAAIQPSLHEISPLEKAATSLMQDQTQGAEDGDDYFEISLYAEDGGTSLIGEGGTPTSDILKKDSEKSSRSRMSKKKRHHQRDGHSREKERKFKTRHSKNDTSGGYSEKDRESSSGRQRSEKDREKRCKHSHRQRSRSRSKTRSHKSHRHDSSSRSCSKTRSHKSHRHEEYSSRSRHRSREGGYSRRRRSRSKSLLRYRHSYSTSCSSDNDGTSGKMKSTVLAKVERSGEGVKERRHRRERQNRDRSDSQSPRRHVCSHYRGEHDNERRLSMRDTEHRLQGRLYSDDISREESLSATHGSSSKFMRPHTSSAHSSKRTRSQRIVNLSLSDEEKRNPQIATSDDTKLLAQEINEVDRQIQTNKKELLKSMLRKERIELLQKNLHGGESAVSGGVLQKSALATTAMKTTGAMQKELELLNRAIVDGKKQLLRVMKKMEEEQMEMNED